MKNSALRPSPLILQTFFQKFDQFADAPDAVAKMRELVLELAVKGKLSGDASSWSEKSLGEVSRLRRGYDLPVQDRKSGAFPIFAANGPIGVHEAPMVQGPGVVTGRSGSIGKVHFVQVDYWPLNTALYVEDFFGNDPQFICLLLRSMRLERFSTATAVPTLNRNVVHKEIVKIPPLAEQKRIVAKVDELMALCDRLEAQQLEREAQAGQLARASLARFTDAPTPANLNLLFHSSFPISPSDLRKSILTLAVQGKLVPQDPNDEPAEECLSRLGLKSTAVSQNGEDTDDESLPPAWTRVRFEDVAIVAGGVTLGRKLGDRKTVTLPYLRVANVKRGEIDLTVIKEVSIAEDEIERYALRENDLLMTEGGDWDKVGRAAIWRAEIPVCLHQNHVFRARMRSSELTPFWFERYFNSPVGRGYFESASKQTTNLASINMRQVRSCPIPLPPLAEQRSIVAKVSELMALVDELETQLAASRADAEKLLSALVAELTGTTSRLPADS